MAIHDIKITTGPHGNRTVLEIDGKRIDASEFTLTAGMDRAAELTITYPVVRGEVGALVETTHFHQTERTYAVVRSNLEED